MADQALLYDQFYTVLHQITTHRVTYGDCRSGGWSDGYSSDGSGCYQHSDHYPNKPTHVTVTKFLYRVAGNPVSMTPEQADYCVHIWDVPVVVDVGPCRFDFQQKVDDATPELTDAHLRTHFTITGTVDPRDQEFMHNLKDLPLMRQKPGKSKFRAPKPRESYVLKFNDMITQAHAPPEPREQPTNPHAGRKKKSKKGK